MRLNIRIWNIRWIYWISRYLTRGLIWFLFSFFYLVFTHVFALKRLGWVNLIFRLVLLFMNLKFTGFDSVQFVHWHFTMSLRFKFLFDLQYFKVFFKIEFQSETDWLILKSLKKNRYICKKKSIFYLWEKIVIDHN